MTHKLKILPKYFYAVNARIKQFEIRNNDRNYKIGDKLHLCECDGENFTGREIWREVIYMTDYEQKK